MTIVPHITTERLTLRGWRNDDLAALEDIFGDADHARFIGGPLPQLEVWRRLMAFAGIWSLNGYGLWAIEEKSSGVFAGWCGMFRPVDFPEVELSYSLAKSQQGKGYMREAVVAARDWWMARPQCSAPVSYIHPNNVRSQAVARAVGATVERMITLRGTDTQVWRHPAAQAVGGT